MLHPISANDDTAMPPLLGEEEGGVALKGVITVRQAKDVGTCIHLNESRWEVVLGRLALAWDLVLKTEANIKHQYSVWDPSGILVSILSDWDHTAA